MTLGILTDPKQAGKEAANTGGQSTNQGWYNRFVQTGKSESETKNNGSFGGLEVGSVGSSWTPPDTNHRAGEGHTRRRRLHGEGPCMHAITIFITALRGPVSGSALSHLHSIDLTVVCMSHPIPYRLLHLAFTPD